MAPAALRKESVLPDEPELAQKPGLRCCLLSDETFKRLIPYTNLERAEVYSHGVCS